MAGITLSDGTTSQDIASHLLSLRIDVDAAAGALEIITVPSVAALKALSIPAPGTHVWLDSYHDGLNLGGGMLIVELTNDTADDGYLFAPTVPNGTRKYRRVKTGQVGVNVTEFGAKLDGTTDDTAAIQAAIDLRKGPVYIPPAQALYPGDIMVTTLYVRNGTHLYGAGPGNPGWVGTRLRQIAGTDADMITVDPAMATSEYVHGCTIRDMMLQGEAGVTRGWAAAAGCGINMTRRTGENFIISNVHVRYFAEDGIRLSRGSTPGSIFNCAAFWNGGYGFHITRQSGDVHHMFALRQVSGDDNALGLIGIGPLGHAYDMVFVDGVKAETSGDADAGARQQNVIVLNDLNNATVSLSNITQQNVNSTSNAVVLINTSGARIIASNWAANNISGDPVTGTTNWIDDQSISGTLQLARSGSASQRVVDGIWESFRNATAGRFLRTTTSLSAEVTNDAYNATNWNGSNEYATKNAFRDVWEAFKTANPGLNF